MRPRHARKPASAEQRTNPDHRDRPAASPNHRLHSSRNRGRQTALIRVRAHHTLADSTHTPNDRSPARVTLLAAISITILALLSGALAQSARADGDPASDVLVSQPLFLPQDAGVPAPQQAQLAALLTAARRDGYPIRVALIASRADLGSVTELWQHPQNYAQFLGQELALLYRGPLLVLMPGGFGFYRANTTLVRERAVLAAIPTPTAGTGLGTAALTAVQRLAAASGHPLPTPTAIVAPKSSSTDTVSWIVFAAGSALIALAWGASLRARPLQLGRRRTSSA